MLTEKMRILSLTVLLLIFIAGSSYSQNTVEVGIEEKIGDYLPLDAEFYTSEGDTVTLDRVIDTPVLMVLVYYECPGICSPLQNELAWVIDRVDLEAGNEFEVISLSFDDGETPEIAAKWKRNYLQSMKNGIPDSAWTFLTGKKENIKKVTDALGFRYKQTDSEEYLHAGTVVAISPDGKISRYLFGSTFNQFDIKMALLDAESGKTNPAVTKVLQFCFTYDPEGRGYTLNITRIVGALMLLGAAGFFIVLTVKKKVVKNERGDS